MAVIHLSKLLAVGAVLTALFACSSEVSHPPTELSSFSEKATFEEVWEEDAGVGDDDLQLQLQPFISGPTVFTVASDGLVIARSAATGEKLWEFELDQAVSGGITGDSKRLYVSTFQGEVVALGRNGGEELWRVGTSSEVLSPAASDGDVVVVHSSDGAVYGFSANSGAQMWKFLSQTPVLSLRGTSAPLIIDNSVFIGLATGELVSLDLRTGRKQWDVKLANASGRTELERLVDADGAFAYFAGSVYATAFQGDLKAINAITGDELWAKQVSSYTGLAIASGEGVIVAADENGKVIALDALTGKDLWENEKLLYRRLGPVSVIDGYVVVSDYEGYIHAFEIATGEISARTRADSDGVMGQMKVVGSQLYVYTRSGDLFTYQISNLGTNTE